MQKEYKEKWICLKIGNRISNPPYKYGGLVVKSNFQSIKNYVIMSKIKTLYNL